MDDVYALRWLAFPRDRDTLVALHRLYDRAYGFSRSADDYAFIADYVEAHADIYHCLALLHGDEPAGYVRCYERISTSSCDRVLMLDIVQIEAAHRGRGLGKRLVASVLDLAEAQGCVRIDLLADVDNETAIGLYSSFGFQGRTRFQMHRFLDPQADVVRYFEEKKAREEGT